MLIRKGDLKMRRCGNISIRMNVIAGMLGGLVLLGVLLAIPRHAYAAGTISNPQATDDAANVYYRVSYTGSFSNYRVYIDTDQSAATGYLVNGTGADYMVVNGTLNSYSGTGSNWSWAGIGPVTYTTAGGAKNWTVARSAIGKVGNP